MEIILKGTFIFVLLFGVFSFITFLALIAAALLNGNYEYTFKEIVKNYATNGKDISYVAIFCLILTLLLVNFYIV